MLCVVGGRDKGRGGWSSAELAGRTGTKTMFMGVNRETGEEVRDKGGNSWENGKKKRDKNGKNFEGFLGAHGIFGSIF